MCVFVLPICDFVMKFYLIKHLKLKIILVSFSNEFPQTRQIHSTCSHLGESGCAVGQFEISYLIQGSRLMSQIWYENTFSISFSYIGISKEGGIRKLKCQLKRVQWHTVA